MHVDAITLAAVADEWRLLLANARIDTIIQPTEYAIALQCYAPAAQGQGGQNRWLYLSAHPQLARAHLTALKPAKIASEPPAFVMLLRKYLEGARIETVVQPRWERVLEIIAGYRSGENDERVRFRLIIEIMGRVSNIMLCNEDSMILGALKRVGAEVNRYRVIASGVAYTPPPPQQREVAGKLLPRLEPTSVTAAQLSICAAEERMASLEPAAAPAKKSRRATEQPKLWQLLTRNLLGCSPLLAHELVYRATENAEMAVEQANEAVWEELAWNIRDLTALYDTHRWQPQLIERSGEEGGQVVPLAFAPYVLEQYAQQPHVKVRNSPSINVLLDEFYARAEWHGAVESLRAPIRKVLQTQRERCKRKAELLQQEMQASEEAARYRLQADLLLAHQHEIVQKQSSIDLPNIFEGGDPAMVTIPLDPRFDAVGNANRLFHKYHKLRRALSLVPGQIEQNAVELATIEQFLADLMLAENPAELVLVKAEVQTAGYMRGKPIQESKKAQKAQKKGKGKGGKQAKGKPVAPGGGVPLHVQSRDGFTILIGKNSRQNEEVTFHQATGSDIWLHARGVAGAHVIIKSAGREISRSAIEQAAKLAAYYSEGRGSTNLPVDYTLQRHVRHMKGGGPGMVIYERERTIYVQPEGPAE
ncbi:MAG TPA: NFACT RNA binding domain-containing protein [Ktedonosporobacter sp.]|jgi:predicted ribosome quality control (RQC) complex YloA/Tae2 family protein|nr:NFACT RNA binding domain-containing protein [Ktedonosporobacter sp.]